MYTRREIGRMLVAAPLAAAAFAKIDSKVRGVMMGAQSYSFRELPERTVDAAINAYKECGLGYAELWQGHLEPADRAKADEWRKDPPLDELKQVRKKFDDAGIELYAFNYSFRKNWSDEEIENGFKMAQAMHVNRITASTNPSLAKRIDKYAQQYKVHVGMHNHSNMKADELARPEDFAEAMNGTSKYIGINLDIGHFTAAGFDPLSYLEQHHDRIITLHIKDRKKNQGPNMPFGEGDTNIKGVLKALETKKYAIPAMIEYEYKGTDPIAEVKKCYAYMKQALES
jgi:sugar phosphate isomerase/epimerase